MFTLMSIVDDELYLCINYSFILFRSKKIIWVRRVVNGLTSDLSLIKVFVVC